MSRTAVFWLKNFLYLFKNKIIYNFMIFFGYKKWWDNKNFSPHPRDG
jgi:hypothetical protein